jgi:Mg-chelatase subunit ChlI
VSAAAGATATAPATKKTQPFPFVKIAAQEELKLALLLNCVDASCGGLLVMGDRGTAKSVAVR